MPHSNDEELLRFHENHARSIRQTRVFDVSPQPVEPAASEAEVNAKIKELKLMHGDMWHVEFRNFARDLEQRLRSSEAESEDRLQNVKRLHRNLVHATAERDAALTKTAAIQAQWDTAMSDLKTLEAERERLTKYGTGLRLAVEGYDAQAAQYREALEVAVDALKQVSPSNLWDKARMHYTGDQNLTLLLDWHRTLCADYETNIARISELTPKL